MTESQRGKYQMWMVRNGNAADARVMKKRALAAVLWFYAAWYVGAMVANVLGVSGALGPIFGTAAAAIIAGDPRRLIWNRPRVITARPAASQVHSPA
jgi:hypothetical protein